jgi:hypothetical protein
MQIAWFDLHLSRHTAGPIFTAVAQRALHSSSRCVQVVATGAAPTRWAAAGNASAATMAEIQKTNRSDFIRRPSSEIAGLSCVQSRSLIDLQPVRDRFGPHATASRLLAASILEAFASRKPSIGNPRSLLDLSHVYLSPDRHAEDQI